MINYCDRHVTPLSEVIITFVPIVVFSDFLQGRDRMVVGFTTTYAISAYHH